MRNKIIFALVALGFLGALLSAVVYARPRKRVPPAFSPAPNPYPAGIYANGIVESHQSNGENTNIYPEVSGTVTEILVAEGQSVARGTALFVIDDSIQRAVTEQQRVAIARAIVGGPDLLIFDEPTASLDGDTGRKIVELVRKDLLNDKRCILIVTHDDRIYQFADRILRMEDGRIVGVAEGPGGA